MTVPVLLKAALVMIVLDLAWVRMVMVPRYVTMGRRIQGGTRDIVMRPFPGAVAYALMILGLNEFVMPSRGGETWKDVMRRGVVFGVVVHGVYNGTGMAVFDEWDVWTALLDVVWAAALYTLSGLSSFA